MVFSVFPFEFKVQITKVCNLALQRPYKDITGCKIQNREKKNKKTRKNKLQTGIKL